MFFIKKNLSQKIVGQEKQARISRFLNKIVIKQTILGLLWFQILELEITEETLFL